MSALGILAAMQAESLRGTGHVPAAIILPSSLFRLMYREQFSLSNSYVPSFFPDRMFVQTIEVLDACDGT